MGEVDDGQLDAVVGQRVADTRARVPLASLSFTVRNLDALGAGAWRTRALVEGLLGVGLTAAGLIA